MLATVVSVVALVQGLTFERASHASRALASAASGAGGVFVPLQERVLDTRPSPYTKGPYSTPMTAGVWRSVQISGVGGLPSSGIGAVQVAVSALAPVSVGTMQMSEYLTTPKPQTVLDYGYAAQCHRGDQDLGG